MAGGRPKKEINKSSFERMCAIQCTEEEICFCLEITDKTLNRWCKETYSMGFSEVYKRYSAVGKTSLRRAMFINAVEKGNTSMQIWLSKNWLGMKDNPDDMGYAEDSEELMAKAGL